MATLILRPSSDIELKHDKSGGSSGYALINESTADGDSTYISGKNSGNSYTSHTSKFLVSGTIPSGAIRITGISVTINAKHDGDSGNNGYAKVNAKVTMLNGSGLSQQSSEQNVNTNYANYTFTFSPSTLGVANTDFVSLDNLFSLEVITNSKPKSTSYKNYNVRVTQAYITITYETSSAPVYTCAAVNVENTTVSVSKSIVFQGEQVTFTAAPATGCIFSGWYSDPACTSASRVSSSPSYTVTVNSDLTLYAKSDWIIYHFAVGAQPQDGTASVNRSTAHYGEQVTFTCNVTRDNRDCYGWYSDEACTNLVSNSNPYTVTVSGNVTLYPKTGATIHETIIRPTDWWSAANCRSFDKDLEVPTNMECLYTNTEASTSYAQLTAVFLVDTYNDILLKMGSVYNGVDRLADVPENATILDLYLVLKMQGTSNGNGFPMEIWSNVYDPPMNHDHDESHMEPRGSVWTGSVPRSLSTVTIPKSYFTEVTPKELKSGRFFIEIQIHNGANTYKTRFYSCELHLKYSIPDSNCSTEALSDGNTVVDTSTNLTEVGKTCTWTAVPNPGYRFVGWYSDSARTNLVSSNTVYTETVTSNTTLYAKSVNVARLISTEINLEYGDAVNSFTYKDADGAVLTPGAPGVVQDTQMTSLLGGSLEVYSLFASATTTSKIRGVLNSDKRNALFPNSTAHPVKADVSCSAGRGEYANVTSATPVKGGYYISSDWIAPCFGENHIIDYRPRTYDPIDYSHTDLRNDAVLSASRDSDFELVINGNIGSTARYLVIEKFHMKLYFEEYDFAALTGSSANGVRTVSVDKSIGHEGDSVTFSVSLKSGAVWKGWYSDAACTHKVSDQQNYTCVPDAHTTLYALAITQETGNYLYFKRNGEWLEVNTVWKKINGSWVEIDEDTARDILSNNNIRIIT